MAHMFLTFGAVCPSSKRIIHYNSVPDVEAALEAHGKETAAIILEPIPGRGGSYGPRR